MLGFAHGVAQRGNVQRACWLVVGVDQRLQKRVTAIIVIEVSDFPGHLVENQAVFVQPKAERIEVVAGFQRQRRLEVLHGVVAQIAAEAAGVLAGNDVLRNQAAQQLVGVLAGVLLGLTVAVFDGQRVAIGVQRIFGVETNDRVARHVAIFA